MSLHGPLVLVLGTIALLAAWRSWRTARLSGESSARRFARVAGQFASAALLYAFLLPPAAAPAPETLVVLTEGAVVADAVAAPGERLVALPEAPSFEGVARAPDLGTALRQHPAASALQVRGSGLPARDRDAARGRALSFEPPPLPAGIVELSMPPTLAAGRVFAVSGRVGGAAGGRVEMLDPAGKAVDAAVPGDDGRFRLSAVAGPAGRMDFGLRVLDQAGQPLETLALPVEVQAGAPLRLRLLAGGPSPETKYLRRWALDAGLSLHSRIAVGGGVDIGDPAQALTAASLREADLLVLDERAWNELGAGGRETLRAAVRDGLGVLLRLTADPGERERAVLRDWGFAVEAADIPRSLRLPGTERADVPSTPADPGDTGPSGDEAAPTLSRRPLRLAAPDGAVLLQDADGAALALWRPEGRGRIALWTLSDSFRLALADRRAAYGSLWSQAVATLARATGDADGTLPVLRAGERGSLCGLDAEAEVLAPDGRRMPLVIDPASAAQACAAFWPDQPGWHTVAQGDSGRALLVRAADAAPALAAAERRDATLALAAAAATPAATPPDVPGSRWPWALAWLLLSAVLWRLERPRLAATASTPPPSPPLPRAASPS